MLFVVWAVGDAGQFQRHPCQRCEGFGGGRPVPEFRGVDGGGVLKSGHALNPVSAMSARGGELEV